MTKKKKLTIKEEHDQRVYSEDPKLAMKLDEQHKLCHYWLSVAAILATTAHIHEMTNRNSAGYARLEKLYNEVGLVFRANGATDAEVLSVSYDIAMRKARTYADKLAVTKEGIDETLKVQAAVASDAFKGIIRDTSSP